MTNNYNFYKFDSIIDENLTSEYFTNGFYAYAVKTTRKGEIFITSATIPQEHLKTYENLPLTVNDVPAPGISYGHNYALFEVAGHTTRLDYTHEKTIQLYVEMHEVALKSFKKVQKVYNKYNL